MAKTIPVTADVRITITTIGADLQVRGWPRSEVQISGDLPTLETDSETDPQRVTIGASGDCNLFVPENARLEIGTVGADLKITDVNGEISVLAVGADASFRAVGALLIGTVGADLRVRQAHSTVHIDSVGADATLHEVAGAVTIGQIGADAYIRMIDDDCVIEHIGADLVLDLHYSAGHTYRCNAESDVICRIAPDANVTFAIDADTDVTVNALNARRETDDDTQRIIFGEGAAQVSVQAGGDVRIVDEHSFDPSFGIDFAFDFGFDRAFEESVRAAERIGSHLRRQAERTAEQVRRQAERTAEKAQREAERLQRRAEQPSRGVHVEWQWNGPGSSGKRATGNWPNVSVSGFRPGRPPEAPETPAAPAEPVTDSERLAILKMVEAKQITVAEAERLLAALEGRP